MGFTNKVLFSTRPNDFRCSVVRRTAWKKQSHEDRSLSLQDLWLIASQTSWTTRSGVIWQNPFVRINWWTFCNCFIWGQPSATYCIELRWFGRSPRLTPAPVAWRSPRPSLHHTEVHMPPPKRFGLLLLKPPNQVLARAHHQDQIHWFAVVILYIRTRKTGSWRYLNRTATAPPASIAQMVFDFKFFNLGCYRISDLFTVRRNNFI